MTSLWFERAWLRNDWKKDVRLHIADGRIAKVEVGVEAAEADAGRGWDQVHPPGW